MGAAVIHVPHDDFHELLFDRPEAMNTLTLGAILEFDAALAEVAAQAPRCLLVTGAGRNFMAGGDLGYLVEADADAPAEAARVIDALNRTMLRLADLDCPTVVAAQGAVAGAGLSLVLACDLAIAAEDARFVFAYDRIAATPDGGLSWTLPRAVGLRHALAIALSGEPLGAPRAKDLGLVSEIVPAADLRERAEATATRLGCGPSQAYAATRRLMLDGQERSYADQLAAERDSFCACAATSDFREAVEAFFARRKPEYRGN